MLIHNKDDIEFVAEFPCFLGHPVNYIKRVPASIVYTPYKCMGCFVMFRGPVIHAIQNDNYLKLVFYRLTPRIKRIQLSFWMKSS